MNTKIEKAFISFRIGTPQWLGDTRFNELMALFEKYKGVTDEVTFFTSETHPPLPLNVMKERCEILARRMPAVRKLGYRTGINILSTIGHHNENLPNSLSGDYTNVTDIEGNISRGSFCPNDPRLQNYIKQVYEYLANAHPDFIWIDDDVRLFGHMPIRETCFCDRCLEIFAKESGKPWTRPSLNTAFNTGSTAEKMNLRKLWLQHNRDTLSRLFELIETTVHGLNPTMPLGFMTGDRFFEGYDFDHWADVLAGPNRIEVLWRPGGGYYTDHPLPEMVAKSHDIGRQVAFLPDIVRSIQSEIENFPYQRLKKAAHITALEAASHQAAGCTGAAFNVLSMYDEPLTEYEPLVGKLHRTRPFYDLLARAFGRTQPRGIYTGWNKDSAVTGNLFDRKWFDTDFWNLGGRFAYELYEIGLPAAYRLEQADATVLCEDNVAALSEREIHTIFSSGVYLDAKALVRLNDMGYGELTGFTVDKFIDADCIEQLLDHPLNRPYAGRKRDGRQSFWKSSAGLLIPKNQNARPLSRLIDYAEKEVGPCGSGIFENKLGGRVCVAGYYPWLFLQNLSKSSQMKSIFRWLAKETLPAFIASFHKINLWAREPEKGRLAVALINASIDPGENIEILLRTDENEITIHNMSCEKTTVRSTGSDGPYKKFILPTVPSWQMVLILA
jgi:hypothetical protein